MFEVQLDDARPAQSSKRGCPWNMSPQLHDTPGSCHRFGFHHPRLPGASTLGSLHCSKAVASAVRRLAEKFAGAISLGQRPRDALFIQRVCVTDVQRWVEDTCSPLNSSTMQNKARYGALDMQSKRPLQIASTVAHG